MSPFKGAQSPTVERVLGTAISSPPNFWSPVAAHHPARAPPRSRSAHRLLLRQPPSPPERPRTRPAPSGASFVGTGAPAVTDGPACSFVSLRRESASPNLSLRGGYFDPPCFFSLSRIRLLRSGVSVVVFVLQSKIGWDGTSFPTLCLPPASVLQQATKINDISLSIQFVNRTQFLSIFFRNAIAIITNCCSVPPVGYSYLYKLALAWTLN
jgi:hypothetical protein